jgi:dTMP kinase
MAELLLYMADRAQHLHALIKPSLRAGATVLCDRYFDATLVYQGYARGLNTDLIEKLHRQLLDDFKPDITFLLDLPPKTGLARAWRQLDNGSRTGAESRFEEEKLTFHEKVRAGYLELAQRESGRFRIIDASQNQEDVRKEILTVLDDFGP